MNVTIAKLMFMLIVILLNVRIVIRMNRNTYNENRDTCSENYSGQVANQTWGNRNQ